MKKHTHKIPKGLMRLSILLGIFVLLTLGSPCLLPAAPGDLDPSFGTGGKVITDLIGSNVDLILDVGIQPDGKVVVMGTTQDVVDVDAVLVRYNPDGSLDSRFDRNGMVTTDFLGPSTDVAFGVALQADGKIVAVGLAGGNFALARYNADGSLDSSFGVDGKVTTDFGSTDQAFGVAIQADGKIVAVGHTGSSGTGSDFALARYEGISAAQAEIGAIIAQVQALVAAGVLNQGQGNALIATLEAAIQQLNQGNVNGAINLLQAFIAQVNALINAGTLSPAQGQPLINAANDIINQLGG